MNKLGEFTEITTKPSVLLILFLICFGGYSVRKLVKKSTAIDGFQKSIFHQLIIVAESTAVFIELFLMQDEFGVFTTDFLLCILRIWWLSQWERVPYYPYVYVENYIFGLISMNHVFCMIGVQLIGSYMTWFSFKMLWMFEALKAHDSREFDSCLTYNTVPLWVNLLIEVLGTYVCRIVRMNTMVNLDVWFAVPVYVLWEQFVIEFVRRVLNLNGCGYFNPIWARIERYGCQDISFIEQFLVFWIGPLIGSVLSAYSYKKYPSVEREFEPFPFD